MTNSAEFSPEREYGLTNRLQQAIDKILDYNLDYLAPIARVHEQEVVFDVPMTFDDCPTATRIMIARPTPGEEELAAKSWKLFGGHRVTIIENEGRIQTDFSIKDGAVLRRQIIEMPGESEPYNNESVEDYHLRRSTELLGDALGSFVLGEAQRETVIKNQNIGEPANPKVVEDLIGWISSAQPVSI